MKEDWGRLADYVRAGRVRAGFANRRAFAGHLRDIGYPVTERTLGSLERGERVSMDTVAAIEIGLGWAPGSGRATLAGGEPTTQADAAGHAQDDLQSLDEPEIPDYVTREGTEDWEWEIWQNLKLLTVDDKELVIEFLKGVRRRAEATNTAGRSDFRRRIS